MLNVGFTTVIVGTYRYLLKFCYLMCRTLKFSCLLCIRTTRDEWEHENISGRFILNSILIINYIMSSLGSGLDEFAFFFSCLQYSQQKYVLCHAKFNGTDIIFCTFYDISRLKCHFLSILMRLLYFSTFCRYIYIFTF